MRKIVFTLILCILLGWQSSGQNLIVNGNFYPNTGWTTGGSGWYISSTLSCFYSSPAYAYVGNSDGTGANNVSGYLAQTVTFPSNPYSATLSFYYSIATYEVATSTIYDSLEVFFYDNIHTFPLIVKLSNLDHTSNTITCNPYAPYTHNITGSELAQLAGLTVQLRFKVGNNAYNPTKFNIDNVSLTYVICTPPQPGNISGNTAVCENSAQTYSISPVSGATSYTWILPSGWTGNSATTSILATVGSSGGTISVTANDSCGSSPVKTLAVSVDQALPAQPGSIFGNTNACMGSTQTYSINAVSGATNYTWTLPSGWTGSSTSASITTTAGSIGGTIAVTANNGCGSSLAQTLSVTADQSLQKPGSISGNQTICENSVQTYAVTPVSGALSYSWILPSGWTGTSTTESIAATVGSYGGIIYVSAVNSCGSSDAQVLLTTVNTIDTSVNVTGFILTSNAAFAIYHWVTCPAMQIINGETNQVFSPAQSESYAVIVTQNNCTDTSNCHPVIVTGLSDINNTNNIIVFPNPANGFLTIQSSDLENDNFEIVVTNTLGQILIEKDINFSLESSDYQIDIRVISNGIYFLTINSTRLSKVFKIQKL